jgi:DoxX
MTTTTVSGSPAGADIRAAAGVNDSILAIGRILIALIFVSSGIEKFMDLGAAASAIDSKGLPYPNILAVLTAISGNGRRSADYCRVADSACGPGARDLQRGRGLLFP